MTKKCTGVDRASFLSQDLLGTLGLKLLMKAHLDALSHTYARVTGFSAAACGFLLSLHALRALREGHC